MSDHEHESFIKTPKQLINLVILAFVVPIFLIILLATFSANSTKDANHSAAYTPEAIAERLAPVAKVEVKGAGGAASLKTGETVYKEACAACHAVGAAGAPKVGDAAAWGGRIKQGLEKLLASALNGKGAMPAQKGAFEDAEIARAVVYMANQSGGNLKEPAAPSAAPVAAVDGKKVYEANCAACHTAGAAGAPKFGDKAAWAARVKEGHDALTAQAIKGIRGMPPRGGSNASDEEMKAAVGYMLSAVK
ncbi:c-type cytochrome [Parvibium lacunae]|uniref:Cytochrome c5 family protein n=1 Tax=Parvibium lacunae TaxID=1888893 RepID=A0A368KZ45_9BURK|nr:c-type cytochrome [Parvibium lacunae]RCS56650.1 cytochrome c5 family protein [Parvibium lacunae]